MKTIKLRYLDEIPVGFTGKIEYENGDIETRLNGCIHNLYGPAISWSNGDKSYWINGKIICDSDDENHEQMFYNSSEYKFAKQQEDLLNNFKLIKNI